MLISIAMCTYDGEKFLQEQLLSIAEQSHLPDELVICDDRSSDTTLQILDEFQQVAPFRVRICRNEAKLGPTKNFERAIMLCSGDVIALADQDDVWLPQKLERLASALDDNQEAGYVFSDAFVVDEVLRPLGYTMWKQVAFKPHQQKCFGTRRQLEVLLKHNVVTGATMAFRIGLRDLILPIPDQWMHDAWIGLLASAAGEGGVFIEEPLIKYRQHASQVIGGMKMSFHAQFRRAFSTQGEVYGYEQAKYIQVLGSLEAAGKGNRNARALIECKIQHLQARQLLYEGTFLKRFARVQQEMLAGRYHRFSNNWGSIAKDLVIAIAPRCLRERRE